MLIIFEKLLNEGGTFFKIKAVVDARNKNKIHVQ